MTPELFIKLLLAFNAFFICGCISLWTLWQNAKWKEQNRINIEVQVKFVAIEHRTDEALEAHEETLKILERMEKRVG